ncbi:MAG: pyruvate formate lyase family protein, partial [Dethiobacteria bacterium]|nr:pyruvate formate lyase family protein [Dethiobacteria bacterium]
ANHSRVLSVGLEGVIAEAEKHLEGLQGRIQSERKRYFYEAVIRSCRAVISFAERYSKLASAMAAEEKNEKRAAELREIARICSRVPSFPAESFREAVQSVYFIHLTSQIESGGNSISLGRIDQILEPYYTHDLSAGFLTPEEAKELLSLLYIKTNEIWNILEEAFIPGGEGTQGKTTQNVIVGGIDAAGNDITCDFSHICLDAYNDVRTVQPNFGIRISPHTPEDFFRKAIDYVRDGALLHFFNDEVIIETLLNGGHSLEDARNYGVVGCLEPNAQGKSFGSTFAVQFNVLKCLEFALSNGIDNIFGYSSGLETGPPVGFKKYDDLWNAYDTQVRHFMRQVEVGMLVLDEAIADNVPSPFASAVIDGCLDKGLDLTRGGAIYNSTGIQLMGFANVVDSLYAVKKVVFEEQKLSLTELSELLSDDWYDGEQWRAYFLNKVPKFGNDFEEVDMLAVEVARHYCDVTSAHKNFRGGYFWPGIFSVGFHISFGAFTGATPDGRYAGDVLGNGITPTTGNAVKGPTSLLNSVTKLPLTHIYNGANLNMRFQGSKIKTDHLLSLIYAYMKKGGMQVQFNMLDSETLKAAKKEPEKHRDLIVRVSGYSAEFTDLSEIAQDEIISRTEFQ